MSRYESNADLQAIAARLDASSRVVVTTHSKPDGDAIGSTIALKRALGDAKDRFDVLLMGPVTSPMRAIAGETPWIDAASALPEGGEDLVLVLDTGAFSQLDRIADWLRARSDHVIVIDHHASGDDLGGLRYVDPTAASCTLLVMELLDVMGVPILGGPASVAEAIFAGLATDTGWFRHSNADSRAFAAASRLLEIGVDRDGLFRTIEETARPTRLALQARALASLHYVADGRGAIMSLGPEDFKATGGGQGELPGTVNLPLVVKTVEFAVLLCCEDGVETRTSWRSKPPARPGGDSVNVSALAGLLGGGGHVHASGARLAGGLEEARSAVMKVLAESGFAS